MTLAPPNPDPPCSKCGGRVLIWCDEAGAEPAVCPSCCDDHDYRFCPIEGHTCSHCGAEPPLDWFRCDDDLI